MLACPAPLRHQTWPLPYLKWRISGEQGLRLIWDVAEWAGPGMQPTGNTKERKHCNYGVSQTRDQKYYVWKNCMFMQPTLPFPNSISNVNPSSMGWKSAFQNVGYIIENCVDTRTQTTFSNSAVKTEILTVVWPRCAHLARARGCGGAGQGPRLPPSHAPGLLAQQRVEEVSQHPLTRGGGARLHSGGVDLKCTF